MTYKEALSTITALARSFGAEEVPLQAALGRVLAAPVFADRDYPPFNRATMDGYAFRLEDVQRGLQQFAVVETIFAGQAATLNLGEAQCYKIMTGAPVPPDAGMIIQREQVEDIHGSITIQPQAGRRFQNISTKGEDVTGGSVVVESHVTCTPTVISALAALGKAMVLVKKKPIVSLFTTGNEVVGIHQPVMPFQIRNSNQYLFKSLLSKWDILPFVCEHIADDQAALSQNLAAGLKGDVIIISGGVSAGDADFVPGVLASLGVEQLFHKVAIKPGKPFWCGRVPGSTVVFALPGNPLSGLFTFTLFVEAYLSACFGLGDPLSAVLPLDGSRKKKSALDEFFPVAFNKTRTAFLPLSFNGSGDILAALHADAIAMHPANLETLLPETPVYARLLRH